MPLATPGHLRLIERRDHRDKLGKRRLKKAKEYIINIIDHQFAARLQHAPDFESGSERIAQVLNSNRTYN